MGQVELQIIVRKPLSEVERDLRSRHDLGRNGFVNAYIQDGALVMVFGKAAAFEAPNRVGGAGPKLAPAQSHRKRRKAKRNRTKTRGWKPVATITSALGQRVRVYGIFVEALNDKNMPRGDQKKVVESILRSNSNHPTPEQVEYFLDNTLEYLKLQGEDRVAHHGGKPT